jgi:hypothetical protein
MKRSVACVYDGAAEVGRLALSASKELGAGLWVTPNASPTYDSFYGEDEIFPNTNITLSDFSTVDDAQFQLVNSSRPSSNSLSTQEFPLNESLAFDGVFALEDTPSGQLQSFSDASVVVPSWCAWTRKGFSLSIVTETPVTELDYLLLVDQSYARPNIDLVIQALRSFPTMMLRRETFPWFIHPHSHLLATPARASLPEALSTCMSIAQMFALRTFDTKRFLWRTISAECRRCGNEVRILSCGVILILT